MKKTKTVQSDSDTKTTSVNNKARGKTLSKVTQLNKFVLLLFVLGFGAIGFFVWHSFALTSDTTSATGSDPYAICTPKPDWGTLLNDKTAPDGKDTWANEEMALIAQARANAGLNPPLVVDPSLQQSANWKSMNMAGYQYMDHDDHGYVERSYADRISACGFNFASAENIAYGFTDPQSVFNAFMSDVGHRANVLSGGSVTFAVSMAQASNGLIFFVQDFGQGNTTPPPPNDTQAPSVPTGLSASNITQTSFNVSWAQSTDNYWVNGYDIYINGSRIGGTNGQLSASFSGMQCGTTYKFGIDAKDATGNTSAQAFLNINTLSCDGGGGGSGGGGSGGGTGQSLPSQPNNLTAVPRSSGGLTISWTQPSQVGDGITKYEVWRGTKSKGEKLYRQAPTKCITLVKCSINVGGVSGKTYYFQVYAYNNAGFAVSNEIQAVAP